MAKYRQSLYNTHKVKLTVTEIHIKDKKAREYAKAKFTKLTRYYPKIENIEARLVGQYLKDKNKDFICELKITIPGHDLEIKDSELTITAAIDKAEERAKRVLTKQKEKAITKKHHEGLAAKIRSKLPF